MIACWRVATASTASGPPVTYCSPDITVRANGRESSQVHQVIALGPYERTTERRNVVILRSEPGRRITEGRRVERRGGHAWCRAFAAGQPERREDALDALLDRAHGHV